MPIVDTKKVQSLIQGVIEAQEEIDSGISKLNRIKSKYQNHNPDLTNSNLTSQQAGNFNSYLVAMNQLQTDHAAIIITFKSKDHPSHGTKSLD